VRHDGDDAYLVVAADKGTATFSDIANEVALRYGFWLGDAFASGGSAGYDHKAMGITARGAWESVRRHFREMGVDVQTDEFTVVGVGDMSGDVFGNGMLLSEKLKLVAAFDHRHVFLDPTPTRDLVRRAPPPVRPAALLVGRLRPGEDLGRRRRLSADGQVDPVSPEVRAALGIEDNGKSLSPPDLLRAILRAPVDLLWNGGIGTYVKASQESHADAGDKANDILRVDGNMLRCRVVGEAATSA
jgi:glutamate dehydrogenase